jgi:hypothetical protein
MAGHGEKLSRRQEAAIAALLTEPTAEAAALKARVNKNTITNWLRREAFQRRYREARMALLSQTVNRLVQMALQAVEVLVAELSGPRPADRIKAACAILTHVHRGLETSDLSEDLAELRKAIEEILHGHPTASLRNQNGGPDLKAPAAGNGRSRRPPGVGEDPGPAGER